MCGRYRSASTLVFRRSSRLTVEALRPIEAAITLTDVSGQVSQHRAFRLGQISRRVRPRRSQHRRRIRVGCTSSVDHRSTVTPPATSSTIYPDNPARLRRANALVDQPLIMSTLFPQWCRARRLPTISFHHTPIIRVLRRSLESAD